MQKNLVIVESPAKAKTIEKFLGKDFKVLSSYGHIRDLKKKDFSIDVNNDFKPSYEIPADKKALVSTLKTEAKEAETVWLASDEDLPVAFMPRLKQDAKYYPPYQFYAA